MALTEQSMQRIQIKFLETFWGLFQILHKRRFLTSVILVFFFAISRVSAVQNVPFFSELRLHVHCIANLSRGTCHFYRSAELDQFVIHLFLASRYLEEFTGPYAIVYQTCYEWLYFYARTKCLGILKERHFNFVYNPNNLMHLT